MWIMVSGPYRSGAATAQARIGVNLALPLIEAAGAAAFDEIMMPLSLHLLERCDAGLRIGGPSHGADEEAARFRASGRPVYAALEEVPTAR